MRTSSYITTVLVYYQWPMLDRIPTAPSSSSPKFHASGWTANTWSSVVLSTAWMLSRVSKLWAHDLASQAKKSRSPIAMNYRNSDRVTNKKWC